MKTNFSTTISMTIEDGDNFEASNSSREVYHAKYGNHLGHITSAWFKANKQNRMLDNGQLIYTSTFILSSPAPLKKKTTPVILRKC